MSHASVIVAISGDSECINDAIADQMAPFDENGDWFADGSRWDWWKIGGRFSGKFCGADEIVKSAIDRDRMAAFFEERTRAAYRNALADLQKHSSFPVAFLYGFDPRDRTEDEHVAAELAAFNVVSAYAFLSNHTWHEHTRMGWFGAPAGAESEPDDAQGAIVCEFKDDDGREAKIIQYPTKDWNGMFYERFIVPLPDDTRLVCVDFHV